MKQLHSPEDPHSFQSGANTDREGEFTARSPGQYVNALNQRTAGSSGANSASEKIGGEVLHWSDDSPGADTYFCIGAALIKLDVVEVWASSQPLNFPPLMRINGTTMVRSSLIPYTFDHPLDLDKNEDSEGGMLFDAKSGAIPIHWDIAHIKSEFALGNDTYFAGFVLEAYQVNITTPLDRPYIRKVVDVGAGGGHKPGLVTYAARYASDTGDRSAIGAYTKQLFIPLSLGPNDGVMDSPKAPGARLVGGSLADINTRTRYGVEIRQRINNHANFQRIEIIRMEWNQGLGIDAVPVIKVVHQRAVVPGEIGWFDWVDKGDHIEIIPSDEAIVQMFYLKAANSVRYFNYRVTYGGVLLASRQIDPTFIEDDEGKRTFPITKNLGPAGHADPINHQRYPHFPSGERYGIAVGFYDGAGGKTFATPVEDVEMPLRRDKKEGDSLTYSDAPCYAGSVDHEVVETFEIFDHDNAQSQTDVGHVVNIMEGGHRLTPLLGPLPLEDGTYSSGGNTLTAYTKPLRPARYDDELEDRFGHNYRVSAGVRDSPTSSTLAFEPKVYGTNYHALGLALRGMTNLPEHVRAFEPLRTKPAGREVAKGLGMWVLSPFGDPDVDPIGKETFRLAIWLPDWEAGLMNEAVIDGMVADPTSFSIRCDAPLGFCTQLYGSANVRTSGTPGDAQHAQLSDLLSMARIIWDNGQINPIPWIAGLQPTSPGPPGQNYLDFGIWRNTLPGTSPFHEPGFNGSRLFGISNAYIHTAPGGRRCLVVTLDSQIYGYVGPDSAGTFTAPNTANFHEPIYGISLVQNGRQPDKTQGYIPTGEYQKIRSTIGVTSGAPFQFFPLIDERYDDVLGVLTTDFRYLYVTLPDGTPQIFLCITNNPFVSANIATILTDIGLGGYTTPDTTVINGLYNMVFTDGDWNVQIDVNTPLPAGSRLEIRYNYLAPFRFWGGEARLAPSLFPFVDQIGKVNSYTNSIPYGAGFPETLVVSDPQLVTNGTPIPFSTYHNNPRYYVPFDGNSTGAETNQFLINQVRTIRQWCLMFDCEVRAPLYLNFFDLTADEASWPNIHYAQRPYVFVEGTTAADNGAFAGYDGIYPLEFARWKKGGFKWRRHIQLDYAAQKSFGFFEKPPFYLERTDQKDMLVYSAKADQLVQDSPALRTFPTTNFKFVDDGTGAIQLLYTENTSRLYVITEHGVCWVPVESTIAFTADGATLGLLRNDKFFADGPENWITRTIGMRGDNWRSHAEGSVFLGNDGIRREALIWIDGPSAYALVGTAIVDLAEGAYREGLFKQVVDPAPNAGVYDRFRNEYFGGIGRTQMSAYSFAPGQHGWLGKYGYQFDQYICSVTHLLGMRRLRTYRLNEGNTMNNAPVRYEMLIPTAPHAGRRMEWQRMKFVANLKPTRIEWYDEDMQLVAWSDQAEFGPLYLKLEDGWEHYVPSKNIDIDPDKKRIQGRVAYCKVIHEDPAATTLFRMPTAFFTVKALK